MTKHYIDPNDENEDKSGSQSGGEDKGGRGGKSGEIGARVKIEISRDDLLSPSELKRLISTHQDLHKSYVDKQKLLRKERKALKEGQKALVKQIHQSRMGLGGGGSAARFKQHPINNKAQFSGVDKQVSNIPTQFEAETNSKLKNDLENRHELKHQFQPKRTFNPKPRGPY